MRDFEVYGHEPSSIEVQRFVAIAAAEIGATPRYIITDNGSQFDCAAFREAWRERGTRVRVVERPTFYPHDANERLSMVVSFHEGRRQLPIVELKRAA